MPLIVVVTGASGVGKTTLVHALEAQNVPGVRCYYFDSIGVLDPKDSCLRRVRGNQLTRRLPWTPRPAGV